MLLYAGNAIVAIARLRTSGSKGAGSCRPSPAARGQEVRSNRRLPRVRRPGMVSHSESSLNAISRMSPPHAGHSRGNSSPPRARSFAHAIREVSCEGLAPAAQQSVPVPFSPPLFPAFFPAAGDRHLFLRNTSQSPADSPRRWPRTVAVRRAQRPVRHQPQAARPDVPVREFAVPRPGQVRGPGDRQGRLPRTHAYRPAPLEPAARRRPDPADPTSSGLAGRSPRLIAAGGPVGC